MPKIIVYAENKSIATEIAQFENEELYQKLFPALEEWAKENGYSQITEEIEEKITIPVIAWNSLTVWDYTNLFNTSAEAKAFLTGLDVTGSEQIMSFDTAKPCKKCKSQNTHIVIADPERPQDFQGAEKIIWGRKAYWKCTNCQDLQLIGAVTDDVDEKYRLMD